MIQSHYTLGSFWIEQGSIIFVLLLRWAKEITWHLGLWHKARGPETLKFTKQQLQFLVYCMLDQILIICFLPNRKALESSAVFGKRLLTKTWTPIKSQYKKSTFPMNVLLQLRIKQGITLTLVHVNHQPSPLLNIWRSRNWTDQVCGKLDLLFESRRKRTWQKRELANKQVTLKKCRILLQHCLNSLHWKNCKRHRMQKCESTSKWKVEKLVNGIAQKLKQFVKKVNVKYNGWKTFLQMKNRLAIFL